MSHSPFEVYWKEAEKRQALKVGDEVVRLDYNGYSFGKVVHATKTQVVCELKRADDSTYTKRYIRASGEEYGCGDGYYHHDSIYASSPEKHQYIEDLEEHKATERQCKDMLKEIKNSIEELDYRSVTVDELERFQVVLNEIHDNIRIRWESGL